MWMKQKRNSTMVGFNANIVIIWTLNNLNILIKRKIVTLGYKKPKPNYWKKNTQTIKINVKKRKEKTHNGKPNQKKLVSLR